MTRIPDENETDVLNTICEYLDYQGYTFWRQNNVAVYDKQNETYRKMPKYARKGVSDIILVDDGHPYFIEVKTSTGRQSDSQKKFQKDIEQAGATYILASSIDDLEEAGI